MSRIQRKQLNLKQTNLLPQQNNALTEQKDAEMEEETEKLSFSDSTTPEEHNCRVVFEANATADQLARGHTVRLSNAKHIFTSDADNVNFEKGIITSITTKSVYSDCSEPVTLAVNLFNTSDAEPKVNNEQGWLHTPQHNDFGVKSSSGGKGYKNILNILPYEKTRSELPVYTPADVANDRYIQQYGSYNNENLWDGVVAFPGEQYYLVHSGHVVLNVIRQNWEQLGINIDDEHRFNQKYVQVPAHVFDRVIKDLEAQVLSRMPFTNLNDIRACFTTKQASGYTETHSEGDTGKYKMVVELQFKYQFPPSKNMDTEEEVQVA